MKGEKEKDFIKYFGKIISSDDRLNILFALADARDGLSETELRKKVE